MPSETPKASMVPDKVLSRYAAVAANKIKIMSNLMMRFQDQKMCVLGKTAESCRIELLLWLRKND